MTTELTLRIENRLTGAKYTVDARGADSIRDVYDKVCSSLRLQNGSFDLWYDTTLLDRSSNTLLNDTDINADTVLRLSVVTRLAAQRQLQLSGYPDRWASFREAMFADDLSAVALFLLLGYDPGRIVSRKDELSVEMQELLLAGRGVTEEVVAVGRSEKPLLTRLLSAPDPSTEALLMVHTYEEVGVLVRAGVDPTAALGEAASCNEGWRAAALLAHGADAHAAEALHKAAAANARDALLVLLAHGVDVCRKDSRGLLAVQHAAAAGWPEPVSCLLVRREPRATLSVCPAGDVLSAAAAAGHTDLLRVLVVEHNVSPDAGNALRRAVERGRPAATRMLLELGANPQPSAEFVPTIAATPKQRRAWNLVLSAMEETMQQAQTKHARQEEGMCAEMQELEGKTQFDGSFFSLRKHELMQRVRPVKSGGHRMSCPQQPFPAAPRCVSLNQQCTATRPTPVSYAAALLRSGKPDGIPSR